MVQHFRIWRCARALRARKNFHFYKSHPHSVKPHFALRRAARKVRRARSATVNREERFMMSNHAFVHSVFGIHSSFEFRVSSFPQTFRTHGDPAGPVRTSLGPNGTQKGPNGTPFGPEKDTYFHLSPAPSPLITAFQAAPYVSSLKTTNLQTFLSPRWRVAGIFPV